MGRRQAPIARETRQDQRQGDLRHSDRGPALIVYLDTSALLKLYVEEAGSTLVREQAENATGLATSVIARVEARCAFARRRRVGDLSPADYRRTLHQFEAGWQRYLRVDVSADALAEAARLGETYVLRAYDALHLGSAVVLRERLGEDITLASWDDELDAAAAREGFPLLPTRRG